LGSDDDDSDDRLDERDEDAALHEDELDERDGADLIDHLLDDSDSDNGHNGASSGPPVTNHPHRRTPSGLSARLSQAALNDSNAEAPYLPLSIISPDSYDPGVTGRRFAWGFADPYNKQHCDFLRLKDSVFSEWRAELREASREVWYEGWRTSRLKRRGNTSAGGQGTIANGNRNGAAASRNGTPYGGPVGQAGNVAMRGASNSVTGGSSIVSGYSSPLASPPPHSSAGRAPNVPLPNPGSPEMVKGMYRQGMNAF
jgi:hypothetical protein